MANANNNGNLIGRLGANPRSFLNKDGSKKVFINIYVDSKRKDAAGKKIEDEIQVEAFVTAQTKELGPFSYMNEGDLVAFNTHIEQKPYFDAEGKKKFPAPKVVIDDVTFLESRTTTQARLAKKAVAADVAAEVAPVAVAPVETEAQELARLRAEAAAQAPISAPSEMADAPFGR